MRVEVLTFSQKDEATAMVAGLKRHGVDVQKINHGTATKSDIVVCWGWRRGQTLVRPGRRVLVMERGYVGNRFKWTSMAWDGLNGRGTVPAVNDGGDRWNKHFASYMWPWRLDGEIVTIMGQVPGDQSIAGVDMDAWYRKAAAACSRFGEVVFRHHPICTERGLREPKLDGVRIVDGSLLDALSKSKCVVTYNSNSGVDAVLAGIPTIVCDHGSMAWEVATQGLESELRRPDRSDWCSRIAWRQWQREEIEAGEPWEYLKEYLK